MLRYCLRDNTPKKYSNLHACCTMRDPSENVNNDALPQQRNTYSIEGALVHGTLQYHLAESPRSSTTM